jgi:hypothetical protein
MMIYLLKIVIFHSYVKSPQGKWENHLQTDGGLSIALFDYQRIHPDTFPPVLLTVSFHSRGNHPAQVRIYHCRVSVTGE